MGEHRKSLNSRTTFERMNIHVMNATDHKTDLKERIEEQVLVEAEREFQIEVTEETKEKRQAEVREKGMEKFSIAKPCRETVPMTQLEKSIGEFKHCIRQTF